MADPAGPADLYQLDPGQFTAARNLLVKRLKAEGQRAEADSVAKLRRPPIAAWALNRLAHDQPELVEAVLTTGNQLRSAMQQALGGDASGLRRAQAEHRRAIDAAVAAAGTYLRDSGHPGGDQAGQRMVATLAASIVDTTVASQLVDGRLDGDHSAPGFGLDAASVPLSDQTDVEDSGQHAQLTRLSDEADRLAGRADRLRAAAEVAEQSAQRARQAAEGAGRLASEARQAADEADGQAREAREAADRARLGRNRT